MNPAQTIAQLASGYWVSQALYVAAKLGIADRLSTGPQPVDTLATACGADAAALYRLLRALASLGIFAETAERHFALTPLAEPLLSDAPDSKRAMVLMNCEEHYQ